MRGNRGGIVESWPWGWPGYFIDEAGHQARRNEDARHVNWHHYAEVQRLSALPSCLCGRLALLLDEGSASTSEILAQGLHDLKRARIFWHTQRRAPALPSEHIIRLPDGDGFQYPTASYTSSSGRVLEGNGVIPDVEVRQSREAIAAGRDPDTVIDAVQWIDWSIYGLRQAGGDKMLWARCHIQEQSPYPFRKTAMCNEAFDHRPFASGILQSSASGRLPRVSSLLHCTLAEDPLALRANQRRELRRRARGAGAKGSNSSACTGCWWCRFRSMLRRLIWRYGNVAGNMCGG